MPQLRQAPQLLLELQVLLNQRLYLARDTAHRCDQVLQAPELHKTAAVHQAGLRQQEQRRQQPWFKARLDWEFMCAALPALGWVDWARTPHWLPKRARRHQW